MSVVVTIRACEEQRGRLNLLRERIVVQIGSTIRWKLRRLVRHYDLALRRGQPVQKCFARPVIVPKKSPGRPVPVDRHPALAPICAGGRPMHDRVDEQERIACFEMDFDGRCNAVR